MYSTALPDWDWTKWTRWLYPRKDGDAREHGASVESSVQPSHYCADASYNLGTPHLGLGLGGGELRRWIDRHSLPVRCLSSASIVSSSTVSPSSDWFVISEPGIASARTSDAFSPDFSISLTRVSTTEPERAPSRSVPASAPVMTTISALRAAGDSGIGDSGGVEESLRQSPTHTILLKKVGRVAPARSDSSDEALSSSSLLLVDSSDSSHLKKNLTCRTSRRTTRSDSSDKASSESSVLLVDSSDSSQWRPIVGSSRNIRAHEFERPYLPGAGACPPRQERNRWLQPGRRPSNPNHARHHPTVAAPPSD